MQTLIKLPDAIRNLIGRQALVQGKKVDIWEMLDLQDIGWVELLGAAALMVVMIWAILRFVSRVNEDVDPAEADREMLQALMDLRREGQVSEDEFRSIKGHLVGRLNTQWNASSRPGKPAASAGPTEALPPSERASVESEETSCQNKNSAAESAESIQTETSPSSTNLPEPPQDNENLPERSEPRKSEDGEGLT
ncbi:MAG: hypothetical protein ACK58L_22125, partial [Planctomycetota bacterium]